MMARTTGVSSLHVHANPGNALDHFYCLSSRYSRDVAEIFRTQILNSKDSGVQPPVRTLGSVTFMYLRNADIYILCLTRNNANVMLAFKFMTSVGLALYMCDR